MILNKAITVFVYTVIAFSFNKVTAQLCQGSLGDAVVNITYGTGANPGQPLGSAVTNYNYVTYCPNDGNYTIASSVDACFNGSWHILTEDHTPNDANGYMMVVNASYATGDFYVQTVSGLCGGTTYEFAAWILNIEKLTACSGNPIKPNVTFNIETTSGTVLMSYKSGDIPSTTSPVWKQYGFYFTTPAGISTVVIRLTNNAPGGCGNDIVLDDITFKPCGPLVTPLLNGGSATKDVCLGDTAGFTFGANVTNNYNNAAYQWQLSNDNGNTWTDIVGGTNSTFTRPAFTAAGIYKYRLAVAQASNIGVSSCRVVSGIITINVNALPVPAASSNSPTCDGDTVKLTATGTFYNWTGPANFQSINQGTIIPNASAVNAGKYYVTITTDKGCVNVDSTVVTVLPRPVVTAGVDTTICEGTSIVMNAAASNANMYIWKPSTGLSANNIKNPIASPADTTTYVLTASNGTCNNSAAVTINVLKKPGANAGADQQLMQGQSVTLNGTARGNNVSYYWTPDYLITSPSSLQPVVSPDKDTTYTLHVVNSCGSAIDNVFIKVFRKVVVPNAFSPNNDGINDTWNIPALQTYPNAEVSVFNRLGQLVFGNKGYNAAWNGTYKSKPVPVGTYYYIIDLKNGKGVLTGSLLIIR